MRHYNRFIIMLSLLLAVLLSANNAIADAHISVQQAKDPALAGWHQTYDAHGRTITIDADILIPDVDAIPILKIAHRDLLPHYDPPIQQNSLIDGVLISSGGSYPYAEHPSYPMLDGQAENNPLTSSEAFQIYRDMIDSCGDIFGDVTLMEYGFVAHGVTYPYTYDDEKREIIGMDTQADPLTDQGHYTIELKQTFHGIPYITSPTDYYSEIKQNQRLNMPVSIANGEICAKDDFFAVYQCFPKEIGVVAEDSPIIPFEQAKTQFETWIHAGLLRDVYNVRLGYMSFCDPEDEDSFYLVPVWAAYGILTDDPKKEIHMDEYADYIRRAIPTVMLIVNANSGKLLDKYGAANASRYNVGELIYWNEGQRK